MTPKQKAALERGSKIRILCGIYALTKNLRDELTADELGHIITSCDSALVRIRGESETAKRRRQLLEAML